MAVIDLRTGTLQTHSAPAPYNDRFARTLGSLLTPQQVTAALANAELGYMWNQADLLDEVRERDGHLHSELQKRELRVAGAAWELVPPEGSGDAGAEIARFCTEALKSIEGGDDLQRSFADALQDMMGGVYQGRCGHEVQWSRRGRWTLPASLWWLHPRRFAYTVDWKLHLWDAQGTSPSTYVPMPNGNTSGLAPAGVNPALDSPFGQYPGIALDRFPAGKFLLHRPRVRGVYPTREGLGRLLVWWSCFKRFNVRDFLAYAEWAGRGLRIGTFATGNGPMGPQPANDQDQAVLREAMNQMSSAVAVVIGDTTKTDIVSAPNNNDVHDRLTALCNAEISKAVVGGTLGSDVTRGGGNRALGEVHERNELMIAKADALALASTIRRDLLTPMVRMNFGDAAPVPSIVFAVDPTTDLSALGQRMKLWVEMGGKLGQRSAANALQMPEIDPDEELLGGPKPAAQKPTEGAEKTTETDDA